MSRPRLHEELNELFHSKENSQLASVLLHDDFQSFMTKFELKITLKDFSKVFTHTSFSHEFNVPHQEQLEFLGDSVLQLILTDELYRRFPEEKEGKLSKSRSAVVNEKILSHVATSLGLMDLIIVGKGEFAKKLYQHPAVLADTFEALLGQVYRYHGLEFTKTLMLGWLNEFVPNAFESNFLDDFDAKSKLQERVLAKYKKLPRYSAEQVGEEFEVSLWINEELSGRGIFSSKKIGEKNLASEVLKKGLI